LRRLRTPCPILSRTLQRKFIVNDASSERGFTKHFLTDYEASYARRQIPRKIPKSFTDGVLEGIAFFVQALQDIRIEWLGLLWSAIDGNHNR
jgi:hypothetical protein